MAVNQRQIKLLKPYLEGDQPTHINEDEVTKVQTHEWNLICPLHEDKTRSASINIEKGVFYCFVCGGMPVTALIRRKSEWIEPSDAARNGHASSSLQKPKIVLTEGMIGGWHSALLSHPTALEWLNENRGLFTDTIKRFEIGWHQDHKVYTIPVRDTEGGIWNVRYYNPRPAEGRRKIWGETGYNSPPRLYPIDILQKDPGYVIIDEGEWDTHLLIQSGYPTVTRTGAADVWDPAWGEWFKDRIVYVGHDRDDKGQQGDRKVARALHRVADVRMVELPYPLEKKHGKDWTDFILEHGPEAVQGLLDEAKAYRSKAVEKEIETVTVLDSFNARRVGQTVRVVATIKGRKEPGHTIPRKARLACTRDAGNKCNSCPLYPAGGEALLDIPPDDPIVLALLDANSAQVEQEIAGSYGVPGGRCQKLVQEFDEYQAVEQLFARPALDYSEGTHGGAEKNFSEDYKNIRITSVGRHDTLSNNTVEATGALYPNPRTQTNEFLAWEIASLETSVDRFELDDAAIKLMARFQTDKAPLKKLAAISRSLAEHVTFIHGRPEMHALMDLTFHSPLSFKFGGEYVSRGWLESLIVGDTRTGKSAAAERLVRHYGAGEIVGGETASLAGLVGGLQQLGGKDWAVTWGVIPINDRRIVVIDELSGLHPEDIAKMSDVRASGIARLTKIQQEVTHARTRLLWLGNPRSGGMDQFTYGVDALRPLIGNPEDIARFDLAMAVSLGDVPAEVINTRRETGTLRFTSEACHTLLMWAWTRQPEQIIWRAGAEDRVFKLANDLGKRYVENPPLVQAANIRIKIARTAIALAARLFSTDGSHENVIVTKEHVNDAVTFIDLLYGMQSFGYRERSREYIADRKEAERQKPAIAKYLKGNATLAKYLRSTGKFRRQDLEEVMNVSREEANAVINTLWTARMVRKDLGDIRVEPTLHTLLREAK